MHDFEMPNTLFRGVSFIRKQLNACTTKRKLLCLDFVSDRVTTKIRATIESRLNPFGISETILNAKSSMTKGFFIFYSGNPAPPEELQPQGLNANRRQHHGAILSRISIDKN
jgi:hypothetical protein